MLHNTKETGMTKTHTLHPSPLTVGTLSTKGASIADGKMTIQRIRWVTKRSFKKGEYNFMGQTYPVKTISGEETGKKYYYICWQEESALYVDSQGVYGLSTLEMDTPCIVRIFAAEEV